MYCTLLPFFYLKTRCRFVLLKHHWVILLYIPCVLGFTHVFYAIKFLLLPITVGADCLSHMCFLSVVAKKSGTKKENGEVMDEDCIWSQSPATRHSATSTKAHCKQVRIFYCTFYILILPLITSRLDSLFLYMVNYVWQYVWMPRVFQFTILCKATGRAHNTTSKRDV